MMGAVYSCRVFYIQRGRDASLKLQSGAAGSRPCAARPIAAPKTPTRAAARQLVSQHGDRRDRAATAPRHTIAM